MSGSRRHIFAAALAVVGALTAVALVAFGNTQDLHYVWVDETGLVIVAAASAWIVGITCGGLFGRSGQKGWFVAGLGAVLSTVLGAALAGTMILPIVGTLLAPMILVGEAILNPMIFLAWFVLMAALHVIASKTGS